MKQCLKKGTPAPGLESPGLESLFKLLLLVIIPTQLTFAEHITVQGEVSGEWNTDTVLVTGDLTVPDGETLTIQPGTIVEFQGSFSLTVEGSISALGVLGDDIIFQVADTTGFYTDTIPDGGWRGIRFNHNRYSNPLSVFTYCQFHFGKKVSEDPLIGNGGAIYVKAYNKVNIIQCIFQDNFATYNGGAIYLDSADIVIHNSSFALNRCGPPVAPYGYGGAICSDNSSPDIRWNIFDSNTSTGVGGGLAVRFKDCNVYNNIFRSNVSALGGGFGMLHIPEIQYHINNNLVAGNYAVFFGGGVANIEASPVYANNTIVYNQAMYGGGFYCRDSVSPQFYNSIIWGNTAGDGPQGYLFEIYSQADFFYCDVEGGPELFGGSGGGVSFSGAYESCLDEYPEFVSPGGLYLIPVNSPCFNAGTPDTSGLMLPATDLELNPRVVLERIDIGADEVYPFKLEEKIQLDQNIKVWPNPTEGKFKVQNAKFKDGVQKVELIDIFGRYAFEIDTKSVPDPVEIDISHLPPGIYMVRISTGDTSINQKLLKISR